MSRYTATINGKEVVAEAIGTEHVSGYYRPRLYIANRWVSFEQWPVCRSADEATENIAPFLANLGFTKTED